jgi:F-type H+-transporting ATPase subunit b
MSALGSMLMAFWLQEMPDMRSVSWWLPTGGTRELLWIVVFALNLLVLVVFLYYVLFRGKGFTIPGALRQRGEGIETQLREAEQAREQSQKRLAEIEARIANLPQELDALRQAGEAEAKAEYDRLVEASRREAEQLIHLGQLEIAAAGRLAEKELNALAAALALDLAAQRLKQRLTPELDRELVRGAIAQIGASTGTSGTVN